MKVGEQGGRKGGTGRGGEWGVSVGGERCLTIGVRGSQRMAGGSAIKGSSLLNSQRVTSLPLHTIQVEIQCVYSSGSLDRSARACSA